ncbi:MAG: hypothetical protein ACTSQI_01540 [Candidatus Helarchaeota archaeon]
MAIIKNAKIEESLAKLSIDELPQAKSMELEELDDILKMLVSLDNHDLSLHHIERDSQHIYLVWIVIHDFYNLNGLPLIIFVRTPHEPTRFIKYKPSEGKTEFVDKVEESSAAYIKIIKIKELPFCLDLAF